MSKRTHQEVRKAILEALSDGKEHSYGYLERKADTNWETVRNHCGDLKLFKAVSILDDKVKITKNGLALLKKI